MHHYGSILQRLCRLYLNMQLLDIMLNHLYLNMPLMDIKLQVKPDKLVSHRQGGPVGRTLMTRLPHVRGKRVDNPLPTVRMHDHLEATTRTHVLNRNK